jgi:hypothetical protein
MNTCKQDEAKAKVKTIMQILEYINQLSEGKHKVNIITEDFTAEEFRDHFISKDTITIYIKNNTNEEFFKFLLKGKESTNTKIKSCKHNKGNKKTLSFTSGVKCPCCDKGIDYRVYDLVIMKDGIVRPICLKDETISLSKIERLLFCDYICHLCNKKVDQYKGVKKVKYCNNCNFKACEPCLASHVFEALPADFYCPKCNKKFEPIPHAQYATN